MSNQDTTPVSVSIARKVRPGFEAEYEDWLKRISKVAVKFPGHQAVHVLKPSSQTAGEYVLAVSFDSYMHQRSWENSPERKQYIDELESHDWVEGDATIKKISGLEFWFQLPEAPSHSAPNRHKMALVLMVVVFGLLVGINYAFGFWLNTLPMPAKLGIMVIGQVLLMTYFVMPQVTRLLKSWLFR